jgi:hypothetical protein
MDSQWAVIGSKSLKKGGLSQHGLCGAAGLTSHRQNDADVRLLATEEMEPVCRSCYVTSLQSHLSMPPLKCLCKVWVGQRCGYILKCIKTELGRPNEQTDF